MEKIKCAAIMGCDGRIFQARNHSECFKLLQNAGITHIGAMQGFVTEGDERFVKRDEAFIIAKNANQITQEGLKKKTLFSEFLKGYNKL